MDFWRIVRLVRLRPWLFLGGALLGFFLALVAPSFATKPLQVYRSTAKILITPNATGDVDPGVKTWFADESTIRVLLSSEDLLNLVLEAAGSKLNWVEFRERIQTEILSKGGAVSLLEVRVVGGKAEEVRVLTQLLCEKFIQYVQQLSAAEHDKTVAYLERERRNIDQEMARNQRRLMKLGFFPAGTGRADSLEESWVQLQARRSDLEREATLAEAEVEQLSLAANEGVEALTTQEGAGAATLNDSIAKERLKLAGLREIFNEHSVQVQQQLQKLKKGEAVQREQVERVMGARIEAAKSKSTRLRSLLAQTESRLAALEKKRPGPEKQFEYANENRQLQMWQESYLAITRQLYQARGQQQSSRREGAFTIVEKPQPGRLVSGEIVTRSLVVQIAVAIPLGLILGVGLVLGKDYLSASLRLDTRIEEALGLPIIGSIPNLPEELKANWDLMKKNIQRPSAPGV